MNDRKPAKRVDIVSIKLIREATTLYENRKINSPKDAARLLEDFLSDADREKFMVICLDTKNQPTAIHTVSIGSLNASLVHPREVFKVAILANSASIILAHNHPSKNTNPSNEDLEVTKRLIEAGKIIGIDIVDHVIIGGVDKFCSLKERGVI